MLVSVCVGVLGICVRWVLLWCVVCGVWCVHVCVRVCVAVVCASTGVASEKRVFKARECTRWGVCVGLHVYLCVYVCVPTHVWMRGGVDWVMWVHGACGYRGPGVSVNGGGCNVLVGRWAQSVRVMDFGEGCLSQLHRIHSPLCFRLASTNIPLFLFFC